MATIVKLAAVSKEDAQRYLQSKLDKGAFNLIAPTLIATAFRRMFGLTAIGWGIDILLRMLGVDFEEIIASCCSSVMEFANSSDGKMTPEDVDRIVSGEVDSAMSGAKKASQTILFLKTAAPGGSLKTLAGSVPVASSFLKRSLSFLFKASLAATGMELFSDFLLTQIDAASPSVSGLFGNIFSEKRVSKQKKFQANPDLSSVNVFFENGKVDYSIEPKLSGSSRITESLLRDILASWARQIYPTVDEIALNSSQELKNMVNKIYIYNIKNVDLIGFQFFVPSDFKSKKDVVDYFIDDVADHYSPPAPAPAPAPTSPKPVTTPTPPKNSAEKDSVK